MSAEQLEEPVGQQELEPVGQQELEPVGQHEVLLASHNVILKRPKYIHRGTGRNFQYTHTSNKNIRSFWSTGPRPPPRTARTVSPVNHSVLSPLLKATCYTPLTCLKLCLLNTRGRIHKGF
ncbi:unnamed protein product [Boreogadus saida]